MLITPQMHIGLLAQFHLIDPDKAQTALCSPPGRLTDDSWSRDIESAAVMTAIDAMSVLHVDGYHFVDKNTLVNGYGRKASPYEAIQDSLNYVFEKYAEQGHPIDKSAMSSSLIVGFLYKYLGSGEEESK